MKHNIKYLSFGVMAVALGAAGFAAQQNATATVDADDTTMANIEAISQIVFVEYDTGCCCTGEGCALGPQDWRPGKWGNYSNDDNII